MSGELKVISACYDLAKYLSERVEKFPRSQRYTLGADIERRIQDVLCRLIRVKYTSGGEEKARQLSDVNIELELLRFQLRLATDLRALTKSSQGHAWHLVEGIGSQVGGWMRSARGRP